MIGPILSSKTIKHRNAIIASQDVTTLPKGTSTDKHYEQVTSELKDEFFQKIGYRQPRTPWGYVWPLPYDAYGVRYTKNLDIHLHERRETINTTPWAAPWRTSIRVTHFTGTPTGIPYAVLPQIPKPDPEGALINAARIRAGDVKMNLLVTLKELSRTCGMIRSRTRKIADVVDLVRKRNFIGAARLLGMKHPPARVRNGRAWADNFLEYQYGWLPLIADTIGAATYLADFLREQEFIVSKASVKLPGTKTNSTRVASLGSNYPGYSVTVASETTSNEETHLVVLKFRLKNYLFREINQLQLLNFPSAGWELTKLSFVWDWMFKVGDLLNSMDALAGLEFHSGSYTRMARNTVTNKVLGFAVPPASYPTSVKFAQIDSVPGESHGYVVRRSLYTEVPPPEFVVEIPFTKNSSFRRAIVATALLRQRLSLPSSHFR